MQTEHVTAPLPVLMRRKTPIERAHDAARVLVAPVGAAAAAGWAAHAGVSRLDLALFGGMLSAAAVGITVGYHRLLTHRAFEATSAARFALAALGCLAGEGSPTRWVAEHRRHHAMGDRPGDPHSPHSFPGTGPLSAVRNLWHAHAGWLLGSRTPRDRSVRDLVRDPAVMWVDRTYLAWAFAGLLVPAALGGLATGRWEGAVSGLAWGGILRIFAMYQLTWCINSVCHRWGARPHRAGGLATNQPILGLLAFGEGWHNNHHAFPRSARLGLHWWQVDAGWTVIRLLVACGLASDPWLPEGMAA